MAASLRRLLGECDEILQPQKFSDYCPNGLQVEGGGEINTIVSGVTATQALLERAVDEGAELVLVHHGFFWKGEDPCIKGMKRRRLNLLLQNNISLVAYHLPLDAHAEYGNNIQLAKTLGIRVDVQEEGNLVLAGSLDVPVSAGEFSAHIERVLGRRPQWIDGGGHAIKRLAWCTGAAQSYIEQAVELEVDAFLSGEISEQTVHVARENGIHYFAAGHHATERYGVQALGEELVRRLGVRHCFVDCDNPV